MKRRLIGALTAALLIGSISIAYVFVKADAETVVAAGEETEDIDETISEKEEAKENASEKNDIGESGENEKAETEETDEQSKEDTETDETKFEETGNTQTGETKFEETEDVKFEEADIKDNNMPKTDDGVLAVQALIDALCPVGEVKAMDLDGQRAAYDQTQEAYDAYKELSEEQCELITGVEVIYELFDFFNSQIMLLSDQNMEMTPIDGTGQLSIPVSSVLW